MLLVDNDRYYRGVKSIIMSSGVERTAMLETGGWKENLEIDIKLEGVRMSVEKQMKACML